MSAPANGTLPDWFPYIEALLSYSMMTMVVFTLPLYFLEIIVLISLRKTTYKSKWIFPTLTLKMTHTVFRPNLADSQFSSFSFALTFKPFLVPFFSKLSSFR